MPVQFRDYYETLGVPKTATEDEIRSAFRKLARKYHPDVAKDKKAAEEKFKEINEAYEVLGDPPKRKKYDEFDFGYVLTVHKAQGSQWDDVVLFDESFAFAESRERWLYTGVTRAAKRLTLVM